MVRREVKGRSPEPPYGVLDPSGEAMGFVWPIFAGLAALGAAIWFFGWVPSDSSFAGPMVVGTAVFALAYSAALRKYLTPMLSWHQALSLPRKEVS